MQLAQSVNIHFMHYNQCETSRQIYSGRANLLLFEGNFGVIDAMAVFQMRRQAPRQYGIPEIICGNQSDINLNLE